MIKLKVDAGYAFDYLAILEVKKNNNPNQSNIWQDCLSYISSQFSTDNWQDMITSKEYLKMVEVNQKTFDAVNKARYGKITAKEVDNCNMERYNAKQRFRSKFFPESDQLEFKT
tara:strand:+ start:8619 stop:8960 length:342 start_codon:yes stop_codon:yes gene_type:complete